MIVKVTNTPVLTPRPITKFNIEACTAGEGTAVLRPLTTEVDEVLVEVAVDRDDND